MAKSIKAAAARQLGGTPKEIQKAAPEGSCLQATGRMADVLHYAKACRPMTDLLCFEDDYAAIARDLLRRSGIRSITDIGCAFGIQSVFFSGHRYVGIDVYRPYGLNVSHFERPYVPIPFFDQDVHRYFVAHFPDGLSEEMMSDCFVANMSVGYEASKHVNAERIVEGFLRFPCGYINLPEELQKKVLAAFPVCEQVDRNIYFVAR